MTPLQTIKTNYLDCCCGRAREVRLCPCGDCKMYPFRFGRNPNRKSSMTAEQRQAASERMKAMHLRKKA